MLMGSRQSTAVASPLPDFARGCDATLWRERLARTESIACLTGIAPWKRARLRDFFRNRHGPLLRNGARAAVRAACRHKGGIACWASRVPAGLEALAAEAGVPLWWIEDGFLRSVGLGAALVPPASLTLDRRCPHYDASQPSDLEALLQHGDFSDEMLTRATVLIERIRAFAVTKYNLAGDPVALPAGRRVILVPGQVEDDRSVLLGGAGIVRMADLLARVRAEEPESLIVYKPHPDVVAKLRADSLGDAEARGLADYVVPNADLVALLDRADAVHVLTSLAGFEALIRGREVVVHGQPFYAGWGLTRDLAPIARRTRRRSLAELAAAALILYPLYADPVTGLPCTPEDLVSRLAAPHRGAAPVSAGPGASLRAFAARFAAWHAARRKRTGR